MPPQYVPASHVTLTFDLLTLKAVSESRVTTDVGYLCANFSLPISIGLSVLDLGRMYAINRQTDVRQHHRLMPPRLGHKNRKLNPVAFSKNTQVQLTC